MKCGSSGNTIGYVDTDTRRMYKLVCQIWLGSGKLLTTFPGVKNIEGFQSIIRLSRNCCVKVGGSSDDRVQVRKTRPR
jgi:hypothetical protein